MYIYVPPVPNGLSYITCRLLQLMHTVDQLMFAAINVCIFAKQTSSLLLMFADSCHESKAYNFLRAINVCEFAKNAKFANINRTRTFLDLQ